MLANKYLKTSQLCMLFLAIVTVTKLVSMPSFLTMGADRSLWISAMICFSLDLILFSIISLACKKYNCTFFEALKNTFGNKTAKVIMAIFALFFFIKALYPLLEEKYFIENTWIPAEIVAVDNRLFFVMNADFKNRIEKLKFCIKSNLTFF